MQSRGPVVLRLVVSRLVIAPRTRGERRKLTSIMGPSLELAAPMAVSLFLPASPAVLLPTLATVPASERPKPPSASLAERPVVADAGARRCGSPPGVDPATVAPACRLSVPRCERGGSCFLACRH